MSGIGKQKSGVTLPSAQKPWLLGGHLRDFWRDRTAFLTRQAALGDVTYMRLGNQNSYFLNHPDLIRDLFVVNAAKFRKGRALQRAKVLLGNGLLTNEGEAHLKQRRMIQPAFHRACIAEYARSMVLYAEEMSDEWTDGETLDIDREMMRLTLRIVGKTLFSADVNDESDEVGAAMSTVVNTFNFLMLPFSEWLEKLPIPQSIKVKRAKQTLDRIIYEIIDNRRQDPADHGDLLSMLLAAQDDSDGSGMNNQQVRDECLTLFLAGHETTANALTWTWYLLGAHPECAEKLREELQAVLAGRPPSMEDLPSLKFTEAVLAESMRLYPPAWAIGRSSLEQHQFGGFVVPPGSLVLTSPYVTHRDPRFWERPNEFLPQRWETLSIKEAAQQNIYFPFGGGVRRCIGESFAWTEGILLIASLARKWKVSLSPDHRFGLNPQITLRPKHGMKVTMHRHS
jgi:cytochrome P450